MKRFAFTISPEDLIKKRHFHYNNPLDYLINLASTSYDPSGILDISIMPERIRLNTSNALGIDIPKLGDERNILDIATVLPPVPEYGEVTIKSGNEQVTIDQNRKITVHTLEDVINGGEIIVKRDNEEEGEESYFRNKYSWSDLLVRINGETLDSTVGESYPIFDDDYEGIIRYDPNSSGGLFFYNRGSIITRQELANSIDIRLHKHPFEVTESRTKVILGGEMGTEYKALLSKIPLWLIQFLNSDYAGNLNEQSEESYNAMVQSISSSFQDDNLIQFFALKEGIGNNHNENLRLAAEYLNVSSIVSANIYEPIYRSDHDMLILPQQMSQRSENKLSVQTIQRSAIELALEMVPVVYSNEDRLQHYQRISKLLRK